MMDVRMTRILFFFFFFLGRADVFLRERDFPFGRDGLRCGVMVGGMTEKECFILGCGCVRWKIRRQFPAGGLVVAFFVLFDYFPFCSSWSVTVVWSHTSDGPKYWIGPGYM